MPECGATVTLLTDFGAHDCFVGVMKGVMASIAPGIAVIDLCHGVSPQGVVEAGFLLASSYAYFPPGTIHVAVVDPGVGTGRAILGIEAKGFRFIVPDNGLIVPTLTGPEEAATIVRIQNDAYFRKPVSRTFHGRDIFSPVAAHLSGGAAPSGLGAKITDPVVLEDIYPVIREDTMTGDIARFDHFGNAITNINREQFDSFVRERPYRVSVRDFSFNSLSRTYFEGEATCLTGSSGYIEFGVFQGNFRTKTGVCKRDPVVIAIQ